MTRTPGAVVSGAGSPQGRAWRTCLARERVRCGIVLYTGRVTLPFGPGLWAVPVAGLWGTL